MNISAIIAAVKDTVNGWLFPEGAEFPPHNPQRLLIGCIDARMPVAALGFTPGSTLIKRNIAALVPKASEEAGVDMSATLEFAIKEKKIKEIIVMGHTDCGGIGACIDHPDHLPDVAKYLAPLGDVRNAIQKDGGNRDMQARTMEIAAVCMSLKNLESYPCVQEAMLDKENPLHVEGRLLDVRGNNKVYRIHEANEAVSLEPIAKPLTKMPRHGR